MTAIPTDCVEHSIREQAVKMLHDEFKARYEMDAIRATLPADKQHLLEGIEQEDIDTLKNFFFNTVYPKMKERYERDKSFESMTGMLKNPAKLGRIIPSFPSLFLKYASIWPTAINVGISAMMAYLMSLRIESIMTREIMNHAQTNGSGLDDSFVLSPELYDYANRCVPLSYGRRMVNSAMRVMRAGKDPNLVNTTYNILNDVQTNLRNMDKQQRAAGAPTMYDDPILAINFGKHVLDQVRVIFGSLGNEKIQKVMQITQFLEMHRLNAIHKKPI